MRMAIQLALRQAGKQHGQPFGAVIVSGNRIIGSGFNRTLLDRDPTAPAEVVAIRRACKKAGSHQLNQCVIYASCQPCPMCLSAICWSGIRRIYFGCSSDKAEQVGFGDEFVYREVCGAKNQREIESIQLLPRQAFDALQLWKKNSGQ